jgi:uncharacterized protein (TIGR00730 family)
VSPARDDQYMTRPTDEAQTAHIGPAYTDRGFLDSEDGRLLRLMAEYLRPLSTFRAHAVHDTIVFLGSARLTPDGALGRYCEDARRLAQMVTEWSASLPSDGRRFVVCSGGGGGIMQAANQGAADAGGRSIGLNIGLPREQRPNPYITPGLSLEFRYFFMRKLWFAHLARAMIAFPGGFGTLDELFEILTLSQTRKLSRPITVLLYGRDWWEEIVNFPALVRHGMIDAEDLELFRFVDTPEQALQALKDSLVATNGDTAPNLAHSQSSDTAIARNP